MVKFILADVFKCGTLKKNKANLDNLVLCLLDDNEKSRRKEDGWLYKNFKEDQVSKEEVLLNSSALLASRNLKNSDIFLSLSRSLVGGSVVAIDESLLRKVFVSTKKSEKGQVVHDAAMGDLLQALDAPSAVLSGLEKQNEGELKGWIRKKWFSETNESKLTEIECKALRVHVYFMLDSLTTEDEKKRALSAIEHAWNANSLKVDRTLKRFHDSITSVTILEVPAKTRVRPQSRAACDDDLFVPTTKVDSPSANRSPLIRTRNYAHIFGSGKHNQQTPLRPTSQSPPTSLRGRLTLTVKRAVSRAVKRLRPPFSSSKKGDDFGEVPMHGIRLFEENAASLPLQMDEASSTSFVQPSDSADDDDIVEEPQSRYADDFPQEVIDQLASWEEQEEMRLEEENKQNLEASEAPEAEEKAKDALSLMDTILGLAATAHPTVAKIFKAALVASMKNKNATKHLIESGYAKKRQRQVIEHKKAQNEARKRRGAKKNIEPDLLEEEAIQQYKSPLTNPKAARVAQQNFTRYLSKGLEIPPTPRPTNVKMEKVDFLCQWIVFNCQFRPGKTRNVRFTKEAITLKNLPLLLRYGSGKSLYEAYADVAPPTLRVGHNTFFKVLKATTRKGSYNQGLSYFYVDFMELIALLKRMFDRIKAVVNKSKMAKSKKDEINKWLQYARDNTEFSSQYLRHGYYADIRKSCSDGYCCAAHALGTECEHKHTFDKDHKLPLVLNNHAMILYVVELTMGSLPDAEFEDLADELHSMTLLALLSDIEMRHYIKHLVRGWWQDTIINEIKRLLREFPWLKLCIIDHKNKLLPMMFNEPMSLFFSKSGISILGAMLMWAGWRMIGDKLVHGVSVWFIDMIMENTSAQKAQELLPGIETVHAELQKAYFVEKAGETKGLVLLSDNALVSASNSVYINALNKQALSPNEEIVGELLSESSDNESSKSVQSESPDDNSNGSKSTSKEAPEPLSESSDNESSKSVQSESPDDNSNGSKSTSKEATEPTEASKPSDSDSSDGGTDSDTEKAVDSFMEKIRASFSNEINNWESMVEPYIIKWLTWEAQRGKSQLDSHFAYINKQLTKACLEGKIDYLEPKSTFEAFRYKGGPTATTVLLVQHMEAAREVHEACEKVFSSKDKQGINSVHDLTFGQESISHTNFSCLDTGTKRFCPDASWPAAVEKPIGEVLDRHYHEGKPVFFPFKENLVVEDGGQELRKIDPDQRLLPTRLYWGIKKHAADLAIASEVSTNKDSSGRAGEKRQKLTRQMKLAFENKPELMAAYTISFPCELDLYWARKKNKTHLTQSLEVIEELKKFYNQGKGSTNKACRMSSERACVLLNEGLLVFRWDEQLKCSKGKVKGLFGAMHQEEQKENDGKQQDTKETRMARGLQLHKDNKEAEAAILRRASKDLDPSTLGDAQLHHFAPVLAPLLKAFVKCRRLEDATSTELDKKLPNKGTLAAAKKADSTNLIRMAFDLRKKAATAVFLDPLPTQDTEEAAADQTRAIFSQAMNMPTETLDPIEFLADSQDDVETHQKGGKGIEEIGSDSEEELDGDESDDDIEYEGDDDWD
jgi:hypothetical protein